MNTTLLRPRLTIDDPVAIRPIAARPGLAYGLFGIGALALALIGIAAEGTLYRVYMGLLGVFSGLVLLYLRAVVGAAAQGYVRVADGGLRFIRPRSVAILPAAMATAGIVPNALSLLAPAWTGEVFGLAKGLGPVALSAGSVAIGGVVWLVQQAWALRLPAGLGVSELGLWGVRGGADVCLPWDLLESVSVVDSRTGARLFVALTDGSAITVQPYEIGSDPNLVAVIIEHFRTHPGHREALGDASEAIRRVEAARA